VLGLSSCICTHSCPEAIDKFHGKLCKWLRCITFDLPPRRCSTCLSKPKDGGRVRRLASRFTSPRSTGLLELFTVDDGTHHVDYRASEAQSIDFFVNWVVKVVVSQVHAGLLAFECRPRVLGKRISLQVGKVLADLGVLFWVNRL
jgi:hypothetical protein